MAEIGAAATFDIMRQKKHQGNRFYITYNPHFREYHAIRETSGCSCYSSENRANVVKWIAQQRAPIQLDLFADICEP